eukprot:TRINITY_DN262_c0_g2_i5.p2 TRINITY_DN262_c0_g2~~TRINITY_DN262_c0_g2_i5.p2  ORF type:complete len:528 (+),score=200.28 TRINITY_DN262_c0_g2_i5:775-2358(+)
MLYQDNTSFGWNSSYVNYASPGSPVYVHVPLKGDDSLKAFDGVTVHNALAPGQTSSTLFVVGFTNPIPANATVTGVRLTVWRHATVSGARDVRLSLVIGGAAVEASNRCAAATCSWPSPSSTQQVFGGAGDMWGLSPAVLTPEVINANLLSGWTMDQGFGFALTATNAAPGQVELFVDRAEFTIYYTTPLPPPPPPPVVSTTASETPVPPPPPPTTGSSKAERFPTLAWQSTPALSNGWNLSWTSAASVGYPAYETYAAANTARDQSLREGNGQHAHALLADGQTSTSLYVGGFSNPVPSDATVTGIMVSLARSASAAGMQDTVLALVINGTIIPESNRCPSNFNCAPWQTVRVFNKIGGTTDKWNMPAGLLTPPNLNDRRSGIVIATRNNAGNGQPLEAFLEGVTLNVYYVLPSAFSMLNENENADPKTPLFGGAGAVGSIVTIVLVCVAAVGIVVALALFVRRRLLPKRFAAVAPMFVPEESMLSEVTTADAAEALAAAKMARRSPSSLYLGDDDLPLPERPTDD